jgi:4-hydroxybutyrate CoA-transferase
MKFVHAAEAVSCIASRHRVYIHGGAATPHHLVDAMTARAHELRGVELVHLHTEGTAPYVAAGMEASFHVDALFVAPNMRAAVNDGRADYVPVFLSEIPALFRSRAMPIDVALVQVSPPDRHGFCSLGVSVDVTHAAIEVARYVVAQVNPRMPRSHGDGLVPASRFHAMVLVEEDLPEIRQTSQSDTERAIGGHVAQLVENGATLQMGIGAIPDAVLAALTGHRQLGVHTEMFSDGVVDLVERGVITGELKRVHPGKLVAGFVLGTRRLYDFIDDNPLVVLADIGYVNDTAVIRRNPRVTAINSAVEVDLTGQVCADSIGTYHYSGVGGQMDFVRGAALSPGGKPIIALPSTTSKGVSRIVGLLKPGASVVTTRAHVHYVATEYGVANLYGRNLRDRAKALIAIAHPDHREGLEREARERFGRY